MLLFLSPSVRTRLRTAVVLLVLLALAGTAVGVPVYLHYQWTAAQKALKQAKLDEARQRLRICLFFWPRSVEVNVLAARTARLSGDFETAESYLNHCLKIQKEKTQSVELEILLMRVQRGEVDEVAPILWRCVEDENPETPLILRTLSGAYMYNLRFDRAYPCLTRWIDEAPDEADAYYWRASILERMNNFDGAIEDYRQAVELDPNHTWARLKLAELYLDKSNPEAAAPHLELLHERHPDHPHAMGRLGQCRYLQGRLKEARQLLEAAVELLPKDPALCVHMAKLELQEKHPEKAERWLRRVLSIDPTDTEARFNLAKALGLQGRQREAKDAMAQFEKDRELLKRGAQLLQTGTDRPSSTADELFDIGNVFLRSGQDRLALYWLDRALQRNSNHQPTHQALADFFDKNGDREKAEYHRSRLVRSDKPAPPKPSSR
jgi:tetratricopeptide (TPR) repeat protein